MTLTSALPSSLPKRGAAKLMIVDDSLVIRSALKSIISDVDQVELVTVSKNGLEAIDNLKAHPEIEIIILDIEMPVMDGITAIPKLLELKKDVVIIMASTLTLRNADISLKALSLGAVDYIPKPSDGQAGTFKEDLARKLRSFAATIAMKKFREASQARRPVDQTYKLRPLSPIKPSVLGIGSSTGGPQALINLFKGLIGKEITVPILITQHMPPMFTAMLAKSLSTISGRDVVEAENGQRVENGKVYIAPGDNHMTVESKGIFKTIRLNQDAPEHFCRPSVNPLFRSLASVYTKGMLGVILTGMGSDGIEGAHEVVNAGGSIISQDEASSVVWGMPMAVAEAGISSAILPLNDIPKAITNILSGATNLKTGGVQ